MQFQKININFFAVAMIFGIVSACHGQKTTKPPIIPIQNMVNQTSYGPQAPDDFFPDKRATREPVAQTVAQNEAYSSVQYNTGLQPGSTLENPKWVSSFPMKLNMNMLKNGQKDFNIYCAPCHGLSGHNDGLVTERSGGTIRPAEIHSDTLRKMPVGQIYHAVTDGVNNWNMPGFSAQLDTAERWAIVTYVRALQLSEQEMKNKNVENVPLTKGENK